MHTMHKVDRIVMNDEELAAYLDKLLLDGRVLVSIRPVSGRVNDRPTWQTTYQVIYR